ncbi:MAG: response regulator, partial [Hyphomicrobiales bacterium]
VSTTAPVKGWRMLVVDDNVDAAHMLAMLLEAKGHEAMVEHTAKRALERARTDLPDVCLLDIGLPDLDGNDLARQLRAQPETAQSIMIAITGYGQEQDRKRTAESGFDHHLVKPVNMEQLLRWLVAAVLTAVPSSAFAERLELPAAAPTAPKEPAVPRAAERFEPYEALHGSFSSPGHCAGIPEGFWVEVGGRGDCLRTYSQGLSAANNPTVLVYFSGDVLLKTKEGVRFVGPGYGRQSPELIGRDVTRWSEQAGIPAIYIARPGMFGSSGDHNQRRELREVMLMDGALDVIKRRYRVSTFILAGQSGGGHIAASLLNLRRDVSAAVLSSALLSVREVTDYWNKRRTVQSSGAALYDPIDHLGGIRRDPKPSILVLSDPQDRIVPYPSQLTYVRRLQAAGLEPRHIILSATDKSHHALARHGRRAAALIARGETIDTIKAALERLSVQSAD